MDKKLTSIMEIQNLLCYLVPQDFSHLALFASKKTKYQPEELYFYYMPNSIWDKRYVNCYSIPKNFGISQKDFTKLIDILHNKILLLFEQINRENMESNMSMQKLDCTKLSIIIQKKENNIYFKLISYDEIAYLESINKFIQVYEQYVKDQSKEIYKKNVFSQSIHILKNAIFPKSTRLSLVQISYYMHLLWRYIYLEDRNMKKEDLEIIKKMLESRVLEQYQDISYYFENVNVKNILDYEQSVSISEVLASMTTNEISKDDSKYAQFSSNYMYAQHYAQNVQNAPNMQKTSADYAEYEDELF